MTIHVAGNVETPCTGCGVAIEIHPPEDGSGAFKCGRCAGTACAVPDTKEESA
jgi:hypothetical protein